MNTKTINYKYDPVASVLTVYDGERAKGFFKGSYAEEEFLRLMSKGVDITFTDMNSTYNAEIAQKIRRIRAIWIKLGIDKFRDDILMESYGLTSTTQCSMKQLDELISYYGSEQKAPASPEVRALRSELLTLCNKMDLYVTNDDWSKVNAFFMDKRVAGMLLNKMSHEQLSALVPKVRSIQSKYAKRQREIKRQQLYN